MTTKKDCGCKKMKNQDTPSRTDSVNLTARELEIYNAGQSFGAAQALRQSAESLSQLALKFSGQADKQKQAGDELLDRALAKPTETKLSVSDPKGVKLSQRVVRAIGALLGEDA